ncbi:TadE family protein [Methylobacterium sp. WL69]|uniref:TadE family protein n=1 Tax=Methylobacterium sp. WL69 TaxID=2603893 RepID=UPI0016501380|nr:TadE family protein [Methylobacterium sp. WL69]
MKIVSDSVPRSLSSLRDVVRLPVIGAMDRARVFRCRRARFILSDMTGASAVEFALVVFPFLLLCLGILQFVFLNYTQQTLSNALYSSASRPESELILGSRSGYVTKLCAKIVFQAACLDSTTGVKVEMMRLDDLPTTPTAIAGTTFSPGSSGDVLVLRATMPTPQILAFIPQLTAKDSVIFRRP